MDAWYIADVDDEYSAGGQIKPILMMKNLDRTKPNQLVTHLVTKQIYMDDNSPAM
jgi:hypothetical protein